MTDYENSASKQLLDTIHSNRRTMSFLANELEDISRILYLTNNERLEKRVSKIANTLYEMMDETSNAHSEMVSENLREVEQSTGKILMALLERATNNGETT